MEGGLGGGGGGEGEGGGRHYLVHFDADDNVELCQDLGKRLSTFRLLIQGFLEKDHAAEIF